MGIHDFNTIYEDFFSTICDTSYSDVIQFTKISLALQSFYLYLDLYLKKPKRWQTKRYIKIVNWTPKLDSRETHDGLRELSGRQSWLELGIGGPEGLGRCDGSWMASSQHCYDMHDWLSLRRPYHVQLLSFVIMYGILVRRMGVHDFKTI